MPRTIKTNSEVMQELLTFLDENNLTYSQFSKIYNVSERTLYDFLKETKKIPNNNKYQYLNEQLSIILGIITLAEDEIPVGLAKNIIGNRYGRLTVLYRVSPPASNTTKKPHSYWKCLCDCGNECVVSISGLNDKTTQSCGCLSKEKASERFGIDILGQKFGSLTVVERDYSAVNKKRIYWKCSCDCGNPKLISVSGVELRNGQKTRCPLCMPRSQGETMIKEILLENNIPFEQEKTFDNCRFPDTNKKARFDFYVNNTYLIEFDGRQHIEPTTGDKSNWQPLEYIQKHDNFKNNYCKKQNIPLIRIPYSHLHYLKLEDLLLETTKYKVN